MEQQGNLESLARVCLQAGAIHSFWRESADLAVVEIGCGTFRMPNEEMERFLVRIWRRRQAETRAAS